MTRNSVLNVERFLENIQKEVSDMYSTIQQIENINMYDQQGEYVKIESEKYKFELIENINRIDNKIQFALEYYSLPKLLNKYKIGLDEFNDKSKLEYYDDIGILDSLVYQYMSDYIQIISFIEVETPSINVSNIQSQIQDQTQNQAQKQKQIQNIDFSELLNKLKNINFESTEKQEEYESLLSEIDQNNPEENKNILIKIKAFLYDVTRESGIEIVKEKIPGQVAMLIKLITDFI